MDSKENIVNTALDQIILRALYDLEKSDAAANEAAKRLGNLFDSLKFDDKLDAEVQTLISQYIQQSIAKATSEFRHIYLQGARDCVILMRELGIIR